MKKMLMMVVVVGLVGSPAFAGLIDGLEGYWPFEDVAQPGTDESGNGRDGALTGAAAREAGTGKFGAAMRFASHNDDAVDATGHTMPATDALTLSVWVNHDNHDWTSERYLCMPLENAVIRRQWDGYAYFFIRTDGTVKPALKDSTRLSDDVWHHIVGTWDGTTQTLYVDGAPVASATPAGTLDVLNDGASISWAGGEGMVGLMDDVAVWSRALGADEVEALWNNGDGTDLLPLLNLIPEPGGLGLLGLAMLAARKKRR